jgi:type I restriction enzyme M protein
MAKTRAKKEKEVTLETIMWNCRVALRNKCGKAANRDAVLALVFLKFAGDKFERRRKEIIDENSENPIFLEKTSFYQAKNVFYLSEKSRWTYIVMNASRDDIAILLDQALADIEEKNSSLKGALPQRFFSSLGVTKNDIKALIDEINKISEQRFHEKDLIGRVYEYFLQNFAIDEAQEKGEFYTPKFIVDLIAELIEPYDGKIYDPCCGSGGMFVQSFKFVDTHKGNRKNISVYGQESNPDTYRLARMNLAIRGIACNLGDKAASTFTSDQHKDLKVNYIMANPPFNLKNWRSPVELSTDYRWSGYGAPPVSNANYAWILHMLSKLDVNTGKAGFLLANGALNADGEEYNIRKQLVENDKIEAIIVLPREMFYSTDISVTLWVLNNNKKARLLNNRSIRDRQNEFLFIDLRTWNTNVYEKSYIMFDEKQIAAVKKIYTDWQNPEKRKYKNVPELCRAVKIPEIRKNNYSLAPSKYIEFIDHDLEIDYKKEMRRIQAEIKLLLEEEKKSQKMLEKAFEGIGYGVKGK